MKTKTAELIIASVIAAVSCCSPYCRATDVPNSTSGAVGAAHGAASKPEEQTAQEDLGYDEVDGKRHKIVRIHSVTLTHVYVIYEGGMGGRNIPRQDLPPQLQEKYPYEPAKVAENQRQQAVDGAANDEAARRAASIAAERAAKRRAAALKSLHDEESRLNSQLDFLDTQLRNLNELIPPLDGKAKGTRRNSPQHKAADDARNKKLLLLNQIHMLQDQLKGVQAKIEQNR